METLKKITVPQSRKHNIFLFQRQGVSYLGYRERISRLSCYSILQKQMLKGKLLRSQQTADAFVFIVAVPEQENWRSLVFGQHQEAAIVFPYPPTDKNGEEVICPQDWWDTASITPGMLDDEEKHFRDYSVHILKTLVFKGCHIYDPACSTGTFLSFIRRHYPFCRYSASDRSPAMVDIARRVLPHVFTAEAGNPPENGGYDIIFCRFLNQEVIKSESANDILLTLLALLNDNGHLILFGHTPVVCHVNHFAAQAGIKLKMSLGESKRPAGLFQYYLLQNAS